LSKVAADVDLAHQGSFLWVRDQGREELNPGALFPDQGDHKVSFGTAVTVTFRQKISHQERLRGGGVDSYGRVDVD